MPTHCWRCHGGKWLTAGRSWSSVLSCPWLRRAAGPGPLKGRRHGCQSWWRTSAHAWSVSGGYTESKRNDIHLNQETEAKACVLWCQVYTSGKLCILQNLTPFRNLWGEGGCRMMKSFKMLWMFEYIYIYFKDTYFLHFSQLYMLSPRKWHHKLELKIFNQVHLWKFAGESH